MMGLIDAHGIPFSTITLFGVPYTSDGISVGTYPHRPLVTSDTNVLYLFFFSVSLDGLDTSPDSACLFFFFFPLPHPTFFVIFFI